MWKGSLLRLVRDDGTETVWRRDSEYNWRQCKMRWVPIWVILHALRNWVNSTCIRILLDKSYFRLRNHFTLEKEINDSGCDPIDFYCPPGSTVLKTYEGLFTCHVINSKMNGIPTNSCEFFIWVFICFGSHWRINRDFQVGIGPQINVSEVNLRITYNWDWWSRKKLQKVAWQLAYSIKTVLAIIILHPRIVFC